MKIKTRIGKNCQLCGKILTTYNHKNFKTNEKTTIVCYTCYDLCHILKETHSIKGIKVIINIIRNAIGVPFKHCVTCGSFTTKKEHFCNDGMWTGVGENNPSNTEEYPGSFANHGCTRWWTG